MVGEGKGICRVWIGYSQHNNLKMSQNEGHDVWEGRNDFENVGDGFDLESWTDRKDIPP